MLADDISSGRFVRILSTWDFALVNSEHTHRHTTPVIHIQIFTIHLQDTTHYSSNSHSNIHNSHTRTHSFCLTDQMFNAHHGLDQVHQVSEVKPVEITTAWLIQASRPLSHSTNNFTALKPKFTTHLILEYLTNYFYLLTYAYAFVMQNKPEVIMLKVTLKLLRSSISFNIFLLVQINVNQDKVIKVS